MKLTKNMTCEEVVNFLSKYSNLEIKESGDIINGYYDFCVRCDYKKYVHLWISYSNERDEYTCEISFNSQGLVITHDELCCLFHQNVFNIYKICDKHFESILKKCDKFYDQIIIFNESEKEVLREISIEYVQNYYNIYLEKLRSYITKLNSIKSTDSSVVSESSKYLRLLSKNLDLCSMSYNSITHVIFESDKNMDEKDRLRYKLSFLKNFNIYTGNGMWDKSINSDMFNMIDQFVMRNS